MPSPVHPPATHSPAARATAVRSALPVLLPALFSGVLLALVAVEWGPLISFDRSVAEDLHTSAVRHPAATRTTRVLSDWVWDPWTLRALVAGAVVWLWWQGERLLAVWAAGVMAAGAVVQQVLKALVGRERPHWPDPVDTAHFAAYPSGHAMTAVVGCGLLLWLLARHGRGPGSRAWRVAAVLSALSAAGVGLTRLYLGVHWPSDVLGGWLLGALVLAAGISWYERRAGGRPGPGVRET
ncbi:phosphatase PAP2 family protein [Streptomyces sp. LP05-1]|uniref:Phosphatase PAP2 family protein n=1 Tax=Streptomyces pyxinae TaxID=2970734 RepID=A0ABT2CI23_9ACTN|nr:phosphatase PAP2 family protein [Streptomyces sp. LP05-1]MCS0636960.1 phosphatase PAP2 family protein [Streptomyces sp. LP05-1]